MPLLTPKPDSLGTNEHTGWNPGNEAVLTHNLLPCAYDLVPTPTAQPPSHSLVVALLNHIGQFNAVLLHVQEANGEGVPLRSNQLLGIIQVLHLPLHREPAGGGGGHKKLVIHIRQ